MRKEVMSLLLVMLILTSMFYTTIGIKASLAGESENYSTKAGFTEEAGKMSLPSQVQSPSEKRSTLENPGQTSICAEDRWNFNDTNEWSKYAYAKGDKTKLIIGVNDKNTFNLLELEKIATKNQAKITNTVSIKGRIIAVVIELSFSSVSALVGEIHVAGLASYIEPNMKVQAQTVPNDPYWSMQWGPQKVQADWAWNTTTGDTAVLVAVVDTGIYYTHPDLEAHYSPLGYDWVNNDTDPVDDHGHGTHCAGIIAAVMNNNIGIAGLAQVRVMAEKVLDSYGAGTWDQVANGIIHATESGAKIISMSLAGYGDSELAHDAVRYACESGVLVVAAAGNENTNTKAYPAAYDEVIAVAATDQYDQKAGFSNWGDWIDLAAPGVDIYSTVPWGYESWSGTSMACPHVAGVAALVWSYYSTKSQEWVRLWLQNTAEDLGNPGLDDYYGWGRIDARRAIEQILPAHELIAYKWITPPYVKTGATGTINATVLNLGENDEIGVEMQLLANSTLVGSTVVDLASGTTSSFSFIWNPANEGSYNLTLYVVPVPEESNLENNMLWKYIYFGPVVKAVVLHSAGNVQSNIITNWQVLSSEWYLFGDTMVYVDYTTLNREDITYDDIAATEADVLIISCAYDPSAGWEFTDSEIEAISQYVHEGHGLIATAGTLYYGVPNNNKLAPLFGLNEATTWNAVGTDLLHLLDTTHPIFASVPDPLVFPQTATVLPYDGAWDSNELIGGEYLALGHYKESAIITFRGLVFVSPWLEIVPPYYHHHLQLLYNAIIWSRYQKPEHELEVSLETPARLNPKELTLLNATVSNLGKNSEANVELQILIDDILVDSVIIPTLLVDSSYTFSYAWTPMAQGKHNVTAYALPVSGEDFTENNLAEKTVTVLLIAAKNILVYSDDYLAAPYSRFVVTALNNLGFTFTYFADDPSGFGVALVSQPWDLVIVDHCNYYAIGGYWTELDEYVRSGGYLILSTFDVDGSYSEPTTLWDTLGVRWVSDMWSPEPVYRWTPSHPLFTFPNTVGDLTSYTSGYYNDNGDHVATTTGNPIAGFTASATEGYAAVVTGDTDRTVLFSFILDVFRSDENGDGKLDAIEQWENAIVYLAQGYEHDVAVTSEVPKLLRLGDSTNLNLTIRNRGLNNETGVEMQLIINGTIVDSVSISELLTGASYNFSYKWTPTEGTYNVTAYAIPVADEEFTANNVGTKIASVRPIKYVLFDQTHATDSVSYFNTWVTSLSARDYIVEILTTGPVTLSMLEGHEVFVVPQARSTYMVEELSAIQTFVSNGGGLLVIGDDAPYVYTDLTSFVGITWNYGGTSGTTTDITPHPVTAGVASVYLYSPYALMYTTADAQDLVRDSYRNIMLAVSEQASGKVAGFADEDTLMDYGISQADNLQLANNMIDWLATRNNHELAVSLDAPQRLRPNDSVMLNATVRNRGMNNETNVELRLFVNDTTVSSASIPELPVGEFYTISYLWTPAEESLYNVTAYATQVPDEEYVANNVAARLVKVAPVKGYILFDQTHGADDIAYYGIWTTNLTDQNFLIETHTVGPITSTILEGFQVFVIPQARYDYTADELSSIQNYVLDGGGLLVIGDDSPWIYTSLTNFAGMTWSYGGYGGYTSDITLHPVTEGVVTAYFAGPNSVIYVATPAVDLIRDPSGNAMLAVSELGIGKVVGLTDEDSIYDASILYADNLRLANNMIDWLVAPKHEHDLAVSLFVPGSIGEESTLVNVTVTNRGLNNETSVYFCLKINGTTVSFATVPELNIDETSSISFEWTPTIAGAYNVTAYAPPVAGEDYVTNNIATKQSYAYYTRTYLPNEWIVGGAAMNWWADDASWPYTLPFDFPFYGVSYRTIYVSSNGLITFTSPDSSCWNTISELTAKLAIAPAWDDWRTDLPVAGVYDNDIYIWELGNNVRIRWHLVSYYDNSIFANFDVVLFSDGAIQFDYGWSNGPVSATVGISNGAGHILAEDLSDLNFVNSVYFRPMTTEYAVHDVAVTNILPSAKVVGNGFNMSIQLTVENEGDYTETFNATVYADTTAIATFNDITLISRSSTTLALTWNTSGYTGTYVLSVNVTQVEDEADLSDNTMVYGTIKISCVGDINLDCVTDGKDFVLVKKAIPSTQGTPRWNPRADLNADGSVNLEDYQIVKKHIPLRLP